ncbi:MAG: peptidoglycan DD-metalloendopeptidase family protein [Pseudomonadota bacterium]|nr:peptidoglycan DD-metalloendopeptidase family protein [Pseudomonadota bacterium]
MKSLLIFLIGALVGANVLYFIAVRDRPDTSGPVVTVTPTPANDGATTAKVDAAGADVGAPTATPRVPASPTPTISAQVATGPQAQPLAPGISGLIVPVAGITPKQLTDTFTDARGADRVHDAIDIMAPEGTPVFAVSDGSIEKLFDSKQGGLTLYQFEPTGRYVYYYAHLQRYAAGIVEKKTIRQGEIIGYVGYTGNANPEGPHLHFAILELGPEKKWWKGTAINPYPLLAGN